MSRIPAILLGCLVLFAWGCSGNVVLDNPSSASVTFSIDGEDYEVEAGKSSKISLSEGDHKVQVKGAAVAPRDTQITVKEEGILHAGASTYLLWSQLYGIQTDRETLLDEHWVEFDSAKAFGDFKIFPANQIYIEKVWDHDLESPMPESKTLMISKDYAVESKIFRAKDFLDTYKSMQKH